jgi:hypothetical protein
MAFGRKSVLTDVRALVVPSDPRTIIRKGTLGATTEAGEIVTLKSDGKWDPADASAVVLFAGIALQFRRGYRTGRRASVWPVRGVGRRHARHGHLYQRHGGRVLRDRRHEELYHRLRRDGHKALCPPATGGPGLRSK